LSTADVSAPVFAAELPEVGVRPMPGNMGPGEVRGPIPSKPCTSKHVTVRSAP